MGRRDLEIAWRAIAYRVLLLLNATAAAFAVDEDVLRLDVAVDLFDVTFFHQRKASCVHKNSNTNHAAAMKETDGR